HVLWPDSLREDRGERALPVRAAAQEVLETLNVVGVVQNPCDDLNEPHRVLGADPLLEERADVRAVRVALVGGLDLSNAEMLRIGFQEPAVLSVVEAVAEVQVA